MLALIIHRKSSPATCRDHSDPGLCRGLFARGAVCFACFALALAFNPAAAHSQTTYSLVDLTAGSPYDQTTANGINGLGHVTGYGVASGTGEIHAFIDIGGAFQDLGLLGYAASDGIAINNADQLAVDGIGPGSTALFSADGTTRRIGSIDGGYSSAYAINNHGDVVGSAKDGDGNTVGFSWIGGTFTDLSPLGVIRALAINDADQIAGSSGYYWSYGGYLHGSLHAFLYSAGVFTDLGSLTGNPRTNTEAYGINRAGTVVGYSQASDNLEHAFSYGTGGMHDLGTLDGDNAIAVAINESGFIVGNLLNAYNVTLGAFVYANGIMTNMSDLLASDSQGWSQLVVTGLNDIGQIVGYGTLNGATHGFLASPSNLVGVGPTRASLPTRISSAGPNPFRARTEIAFTLSLRAAAGDLRLEIFDPSGRRVATLMDQRMTPGAHALAWNGRADDGGAVPGGVYLARLMTQDGTSSRKLVLLK